MINQYSVRNYSHIIILLLVALLSSCGVEELVVIVPDHKVVFSEPDGSFCSINELYWLPDNEHILMNDFCNGTIKKINWQTGFTEYLSIPDQYQNFFVSNEIPDYFFYLALSSLTETTFKLCSYHLNTNRSELILNGIQENPITSKYLVGGKKLAISGNPVKVIDLETGETEVIPLYGSVKAFSSDHNQLLLYSLQYSNFQLLITGALMYDFTCQCTSPVYPAMYPKGVIWNTQGMFGYEESPDNEIGAASSNLVLTNFTTGDTLTTISKYLGGPWSAFNGTKILVYSYRGQGIDSEGGNLRSFDCSTHLTTTLLNTFSSSPYDRFNLNEVSISPDQTKIAYTYQGVQIRVKEL